MEPRTKDRRGLGWTLRQLRHRLIPGALILCYHRIAEVLTDPHSLCVTPQCFAEQLGLLRQHTQPMQLSQLVRALRHGNLPRRAVVITFDDGYADTLYQAKPLLEHYDLPATAFVTAGCLNMKREMWWDELEHLFLQPGTLPERLSVTINGNVHAWDLREAAYYSEDDFLRHASWTMESRDSPHFRQRLFRILHQLVLPLPEVERRQILNQLWKWSEAHPAARPAHRPLSPDELVRLAEGTLIEVGAHSVTHPVLPKLPLDQQREEIRGSKTAIEKIVGHPVTTFAYPFGARSPETVALVQDAGYECACISFDDVVFRSTDRFQLPRTCVGNWDGDTFQHQLGLRV